MKKKVLKMIDTRKLNVYKYLMCCYLCGHEFEFVFEITDDQKNFVAICPKCNKEVKKF